LRLIASFLSVTFAYLSPGAATELPTAIPPFSGEIIPLN
jgi:hypothetical protein